MKHMYVRVSFGLLLILLLIYGEIFCQSKNSQKEPRVRWEHKSTKGFVGSPVIDNQQVVVGGLDSVLYALDLRSGKVNWKFRTRGPIRSNPVIAGDNIFLSGGDAMVYCISRSTGKVRWGFATMGGLLGERRYDPADYFDSAPAVKDGKVYVGSGYGTFYCLDAANGNVNWTFKANDIIHTTPVITKNKIVFGASDGFLYCLNMDGSLHWKYKSVGHRYFPKGEMQGSPVASGDLVFIGARDYNIYAFDVASGYGHWNKQFPIGWITALTANDTALVAGTSDDRLLISFDPQTGVERWRTNAGFNIFGPPTIHGRNVYAGTQIGKVFEVDYKTGKINWTFTTNGYRQNRLKYFKEDDSFRDDFPSLIKSFDDYIRMLYHIGAIYSSPAVTENEVIVSTSEGIVYCLQR